MHILDTLNQIHSLCPQSNQLLGELVQEQELPKGYPLLHFGQVDLHLHYIVKGSGRVYYLRDGQDITDYIAIEGQFLGGVESLFTRKPSHKAMEITEDSIVQSIVYDAFERLCQQHLDIAQLGRKIAVFAFLECQRRIEDIRFLPAAERYRELEKKYPGISNRIPLKHLASYLGITQVSLSRIRSGQQ
ncbi:Crp/Fnr family transcriptional regulator [Flavihumibacter rivuli]|uniref:Crp/Fnr family transcriptional regulator n=1 Tax=Flavihumibacter rivuli TaxID=2838156 RepID=UPI001BDEDD4C|nr:Crp/Fnr family transcriptional regulator [Flavihumibacter rivuli]ULQ55192.1 Crp/Fnr family transcriptional regulator [Flavihumibacter rivuli]